MTFIFTFVLVILLSLFIVKPFITTILASILAVYVFYPIYQRINNSIKKPQLSAILCTLIVVFMITIPLAVFINSLSSDVYTFYLSTKQILGEGGNSSVVDTASNILQPLISYPELKFQIDSTLTKITSVLLDYLSQILFSIPKILLNLVVFIFLVFTFFRDGNEIMKKVYEVLPLKKDFKNDLKKQTSDVIYATIYGNVIFALIQGMIGAIGFFILGIGSPVFWGFIIFILALLPFIGAGMVWVPAMIIQLIGYYDSIEGSLLKVVGILISGLIMSGLDIFYKPKVIGNRAKLHPSLIVLGIFGGVALMGFMGFFIGPLILALFVSFFTIYEGGNYEIKS